MSLILTVTQRSISKICIPNKVANTMLPCRKGSSTKTTKSYENVLLDTTFHIMSHYNSHPQRELAAASSNSSDYCGSKVSIFRFNLSLWSSMSITFKVHELLCEIYLNHG